MTRRKLHKRSRQKVKFHKVQESLRKNGRKVWPRLFDSRNEDKETNTASRQRSPESVLFESQHADSLCDNKLSPEIIPKESTTRSESLKNDSKIDDEIAARIIEQSSPILYKDRESELPMYNFKHGTKCTNDFPNLEDFEERKRDATKSIGDPQFDLTESYSFSFSTLSNEPNNNANRTAEVTHDGRSSSNTAICRNISESVISRSNLESQSLDMCTFANVPGLANFNEKRSFEISSNQREDHYVFETMNDCYLLDKTFSMNDNLTCEINDYLDEQSSTIIVNKLGMDRVSESLDFEILRETDERCEPAGSSVRRSFGGPDHGSRNNLDTKKRTSSDKKFDVAFEKIGERLTANWREFRKIFAYLRRANRRTRGEDAVERDESLLHRYRRFPYISVSTLSLPTSVFCTPSSSLRKLNHEARECGKSKRETEKNGISPKFTTPRGLTKRCRRTTLTFGDENEGEAAKHRQPAIRTDITNPLPEGKKNEGRSFLLDPSSFDETRQDSRIPKSTIASDIELSDCDGRSDSLQKVYESFRNTPS